MRALRLQAGNKMAYVYGSFFSFLFMFGWSQSWRWETKLMKTVAYAIPHLVTIVMLSRFVALSVSLTRKASPLQLFFNTLAQATKPAIKALTVKQGLKTNAGKGELVAAFDSLRTISGFVWPMFWAKAYEFFQQAPDPSQSPFVRFALNAGGQGGVFLVAACFNMMATLIMWSIPQSELEDGAEASAAKSTRDQNNRVDEEDYTFAIIKPEAVEAGNAPAIKKMAEDAGFTIAYEEVEVLPDSRVRELYWEHRSKDWFPDLVAHMTSGPSIKLVLERA